jgi:non-ribosomal peptide synthetase component F
MASAAEPWQIVHTAETLNRFEMLQDAVALWSSEPPITAVVSSVDGTLSYNELLRRAKILAGKLDSAPGTVVAVFTQRSAASYVAMLAVLLRGATWLMIDETVRDTPGRLQHMLEQAEVEELILHKDVATGSEEQWVERVVALDDIDWDAEITPVLPTLPAVEPNRFAYMVRLHDLLHDLHLAYMVRLHMVPGTVRRSSLPAPLANRRPSRSPTGLRH